MTQKKGVTREVQELLAKCEEQGMTVTRTTKGFMVYGKDGKRMVAVHATPSDWRAVKNTTSRLRKIGYEDEKSPENS